VNTTRYWNEKIISNIDIGVDVVWLDSIRQVDGMKDVVFPTECTTTRTKQVREIVNI